MQAGDQAAIQHGMAALRSNRPDEAERAARAVLAQRADDPDALHILGLSLLMRQRAGEAVAPLLQAAGASANPIVETHAALALRNASRLTEAVTWLTRATGRQPAYVPAFHELGIVLCMLQRYDEAETALQRGLNADPSAAELAVELGGVHIFRAEPAKAKAAFARALALAPGHPRALQGTGTALLFEGDFAGAAGYFQQVLAQQPDHIRARLDLAHCLLELGRFDDALACLRALLAIAPNAFSTALRVLISSGRGRFWLRPSSAAAALMPNAARTAGS